MSDEEDHKHFLQCCNEFVTTTNTDMALAHFYLQNNEFDLKKALDDYNSQEHVVIRGFTVPKVERYGLTSLKVLSWNLEGLQSKDLTKRMQTAIEVMKNCEAKIIVLQELIEETEIQIRECLQKDYDIFTDDTCKDSYYCGIIVKKDRNIEVLSESFEIRSFTKSSSGRHMLILNIQVNNHYIKIITSHLESTRDFSDERKMQLLEAFDEMQTCDLAIFAGDLNLRDKEITDIGGLPDNIADIWQFTGSRHEIKNTWDPKRNFNANQLCPKAYGLRFDRMYLYKRPDEESSTKFTPVYFELEGLKKVEQGIRFPSDHWAILAHFDL